MDFALVVKLNLTCFKLTGVTGYHDYMTYLFHFVYEQALYMS